MGRYIHWPDVVGRYPAAAKIVGAEGVGSYFMLHAEAEIDGRLAVRYTTPFANTPAPLLVQDLCIDLTYYKLTQQQEKAKELWTYIKDRLDSLIAGTIVLPGEFPALGLPAVRGAWLQGSSYHSAFGPDDPLNWTPDPALIEAAQDERG